MVDYYKMSDPELYNHVFGPGKIIIVHGRLGSGKSNTMVRIMETLAKEIQYKKVLHNIQFHDKRTRPNAPKPPRHMIKVWTMAEMLREMAAPRAKWFAQAEEKLIWDYQEGLIPESLPTFMATLDEAKDFLDKMRSGNDEAIQFIKKFVPAIRKLGMGMALIYHGKNETVKDLRGEDGGQFLSGELFCPKKGSMILDLKEEAYPELFDDNFYDGMDAPFGYGPIEISGVKKTKLLMDTYHTATFTIEQGMDIGYIWRRLARFSSIEAPGELLKLLNEIEKPAKSDDDGFPIKSKAELAAYLLKFGNRDKLQGKLEADRKYNISQEDFADIVGVPKSTAVSCANRLYDDWRKNWNKSR